MSIKILYTGLDTHLGGIETFILKTLQNIDKEKYHIDFLVYKGETPCFLEELSNLGCNFKYGTNRTKDYRLFKSEIESVLLSEKYDIVHCHLNSLSNIGPARIAHKLNIPVVLHSHNSSAKLLSVNGILNQLNHLFIPKTNVTNIAVSSVAGKWMFRKSNFTVINNGIDTSKFKFDEEKRIELRKNFKINQDSTVLINVGAFRRQKNHQFLIDIFKEYNLLNPNSYLLLVGDGELKQEIQHKVALCKLDKNVIFTGNRNDISSLLNCADGFVFPSLYEGFGIALIEAETAGLYCYASDTIPEDAFYSEKAFKISLHNPISWASLINSTIKGHYSDSCKEAFEKGYDIKRQIESLEFLYDNIVKN